MNFKIERLNMIRLTEICTEEQIGNLRKLLAYLETLPEDYAHFDMAEFCKLYTPVDLVPGTLTFTGRRPYVVPPTPCGSCGCLVGHGPYAGIEAYPIENWMGYCYRVFGTRIHKNCPLWHWLFSAEWAENHNTLAHAIGRLKQVLDTGDIPEVYNYL